MVRKKGILNLVETLLYCQVPTIYFAGAIHAYPALSVDAAWCSVALGNVAVSSVIGVELQPRKAVKLNKTRESVAPTLKAEQTSLARTLSLALLGSHSLESRIA